METESPAQRQARIRREKREAKIRAGGNERLDKIRGVSGLTTGERGGGGGGGGGGAEAGQKGEWGLFQRG